MSAPQISGEVAALWFLSARAESQGHRWCWQITDVVEQHGEQIFQVLAANN